MSTPQQNSRQSGEYDGPPPRVSVRDYVIAVGLAVVLVLAILYLGGTPLPEGSAP